MDNTVRFTRVGRIGLGIGLLASAFGVVELAGTVDIVPEIVYIFAVLGIALMLWADGNRRSWGRKGRPWGRNRRPKDRNRRA